MQGASVLCGPKNMEVRKTFLQYLPSEEPILGWMGQHCTRFFSYIHILTWQWSRPHECVIFLHNLGSYHWLNNLIHHPPFSSSRFPLFSLLSWLNLAPLLLSYFLSSFFSTYNTGTSCTNTPPSLFRLSFLLLSYFLSFLICTPEGVVCLLTSWSKASAGLRLAPIIRAWQGAAVSTCQPNKHPLWHPPGCVWRGVSQPPSSGPLISWMPHSAHTSTRLLCSGQAAIVLPCTAILMTLILLEAFRLVWDMVRETKAEREREN